MNKSDGIKRISLDLPSELVKIIDRTCVEQYITRRKWFIDAAKYKIEKENIEKVDMIVKK